MLFLERLWKTQEQEQTQKNLNMLFNGRNYAIDCIEDYDSMILEAKTKSAEELKAQVKADNNSESLLNEIREIAYSLSQSKETTKKSYSDIIKSIPIQKWILYL